jgi:hypothetical protein
MAAKAKLAGNTLIYGHRKQPDMKWDISTPELRAKAFSELFQTLKKDWQVYSADYWGKTNSEQEIQKRLYGMAEKGVAGAAETLLTMRINYEYEQWRIVEAPKSGDGEPKMVLAALRSKVFVKDIRREDNGRYSFVLSNGEQVEFAYMPINTTSHNGWENGYIVKNFLVDSFQEKLGRDQDFIKKMTEVLSHMNYMRMTLYYTMYPERLPLGKNLALWQSRSISGAEGYIEDLGENPVEKLEKRTVRPTNIQKAQDTVSELVLHYEGLLSHIRRLVAKKSTVEEFEQYTLPSYTKKLEEIKKGIVTEI